MTAPRRFFTAFAVCSLILLQQPLRADEDSDVKKPADVEKTEKGDKPEATEREKAKQPESEKTVPYPGNIEDSVVKINVTARTPDYFRPWTKASPSKASGSGVVIDGSRILTNAHVVMHASEVLVQLRKGGDQFTAKVRAIAPGIDLAIVELKDPSGLERIKPLELAKDLAEVKSHISVFGYPQGGDDLSVTDGIVSRIEYTSYNYGASGLRIQVDAALNPGNSGGPAIQDGKIAGLVFSKIQEADNIGYLIPPEEIEAFLEDIKDGKYEGNPQLFDNYQTAENEALRQYLKLSKDATGLVVTRPYRDEDEDYPLKKWDVITRIGEHVIDNQGYVDVRPGLRLKFQYYVPKIAKDGKVELQVIRKGKEKTVNVEVKPDRDLLIPPLKDKYPDYFIYGPIVFTPATQEYVMRTGSSGSALLWAMDSPILKRMYDLPAESGEQLVIIASRMFPHPIAKGYDNRPLGVIAKVNGTEIKNLRQLAKLLREADGEFLRFEMGDRNESLVFRTKEMKEATDQILEDEGIRYRASDSLRDVWKGE
jgi:S1-C subfamily serine protease